MLRLGTRMLLPLPFTVLMLVMLVPGRTLRRAGAIALAVGARALFQDRAHGSHA